MESYNFIARVNRTRQLIPGKDKFWDQKKQDRIALRRTHLDQVVEEDEEEENESDTEP